MLCNISGEAARRNFKLITLKSERVVVAALNWDPGYCAKSTAVTQRILRSHFPTKHLPCVSPSCSLSIFFFFFRQVIGSKLWVTTESSSCRLIKNVKSRRFLAFNGRRPYLTGSQDRNACKSHREHRLPSSLEGFLEEQSSSRATKEEGCRSTSRPNSHIRLSLMFATRGYQQN